MNGEPTPSLRASEAKLQAIAVGLRGAGSGGLRFISGFNVPSLDEALDMLTRLVRQSGRPLSFSLVRRQSAPKLWRSLLARTSAAQAEGLAMAAKVAPQPVGGRLGLQGSLAPFRPAHRHTVPGLNVIDMQAADIGTGGGR